MATIKELETVKVNTWIEQNVLALCTQTNVYNEIFTAFHERKLDKVMDGIMITSHGKEPLIDGYDEMVGSYSFADVATQSYLMEKAPYIKKCLEYIDAEYNPIENYAGVEHEVMTDTMDARRSDYARADAATEDKTTTSEQHSTYSYPQHTTTSYIGKTTGYDVEVYEAKRETKVETDQDATQTTQVAPFESSEFFNKEKVTSKPAETTTTVSRVATGSDAGKDKTHYSPRTDEMVDGQHDDEVTTDEFDVTNSIGARGVTGFNASNSYEDVHTRDLTKSGNIGVLTAAEMLTRDNEFWKNFNFLYDLCSGIVSKVAEGVIAL